MRRPALIFDLGNVVAYFDYTQAAAKLGARLGMSGEALLDRLRTLGFSGLVKSYESGRMSATEFSRSVVDLIELDMSHDEFVAAWSDIFTANESLAPVIEFLKARGYTLVLGSNTNDVHARQFRVQFAETLRHFDALVLSFEVGHVKPAPEFYLACAGAAGAAPGECVFIDDLPENVEGARAAGLMALLYQGTERLTADLAAMGVELPHPARDIIGNTLEY